MIRLTSGQAEFYNHRWSFTNSLQVGGKSLKSFEEWNFQRWIVLSLKDIKLDLKTPMESFPSIERQWVTGWEYPCWSRKTVEGRFLKGKLLKKLKTFLIPDPAVNVHKQMPIWQTRLWWRLLPRPLLYCVTWKRGRSFISNMAMNSESFGLHLILS